MIKPKTRERVELVAGGFALLLLWSQVALALHQRSPLIGGNVYGMALWTNANLVLAIVITPLYLFLLWKRWR